MKGPLKRSSILILRILNFFYFIGIIGIGLERIGFKSAFKELIQNEYYHFYFVQLLLNLLYLISQMK
jgi:hypothetical protein